MLDLTGEFGARVAQQLQTEEIIWLTTVGADGTPQPSAVWFVWDGQSFLIYSRDNASKLKNIQRNSRVALNLNSDPLGNQVAVITGDAQIDESVPPCTEISAYMDKYGAGITRIGLTPEHFAAAYSVPIRVTPAKLRGH